jgi:hypothetical protein
MSRIVASCLLALVVESVASAQPVISAPSTTVVPGGQVLVSVKGSPGHNFAVIGSATNQGFAFGGVSLGVGNDVALLGLGVLDAAGDGAVPVTPPLSTRDRYFVQAVTSPSPGFVPLQASNTLVLVSSDVARSTVAIGGIVNANGSTQQLSPGVTVTRTGTGTYRIDCPGLFGTFVVPTFTPLGHRFISSMFYDSNGATVQFDADTVFVFTIVPVRR